MKKLRVLRTVVPVAIVLVFAVAYIAHFDFGMLSSFGWSYISMICPLGALTAMLAAKIFIPHAVIALVIGIVLMIIFGRAFCGWVCPVPVMQRFRDLVARITKEGIASGSAAKRLEQATEAEATEAVSVSSNGSKELDKPAAKAAACSSCAKKRGAALDSRHIILGGSLLTAAIFGFPVFCLICPIGLTFGTIFLLINLFGSGDVTWTVVVVPAMLLIEIVFLRKWCGKFCPLSAAMSLSSKLGRFFRPKVNETTCKETANGEACGICSDVCPEKIDPRELGTSPVAVSDCTKCLACAKSCPTQSIKLPIWSAKAIEVQKSDN